MTDANIVMDGKHYMVIVGFSELLKRNAFKVVNKKWQVEAFELSSEKMALYLCSMLDKTFDKPIEESIINAEDASALEKFASNSAADIH